MELQRTPGANVKLTSEIEGEAENGFDDAEIGVVRDNARQLKFKTEFDGLRRIGRIPGGLGPKRPGDLTSPNKRTIAATMNSSLAKPRLV